MSSWKPHVLIVGGGIGGLMLGVLLERAGIPYTIFERSPEVRPLGSVMSLNASVLPLFEQLGLYDRLNSFSLKNISIDCYDGDLKLIAAMEMSLEKLIGYDYLVFERPKLYELLVSQIPTHRIHMQKKLLKVIQGKDKDGNDADQVTIQFADNTSYSGDILVGADGAYSATRQNIYKEMAEKGVLPPKDADDLRRGFLTLVGTTEAMDPEKFTDLKTPTSQFAQIIGNKNSWTWTTFTMPQNRFCWCAQLQLSASEFENLKFRNNKNVDWDPDSQDPIIKEISNFKTPNGPLGLFIDATPKDRISKVYLEDKFFETWHHGRAVLIGDAAHKLLPSMGQGAVNALQDAVVLANCLYDLESTSVKDIGKAFETYKSLRAPFVKVQYEESQVQAKLMFGQTRLERFFRYIAFNYIPKSLKYKGLVKNAYQRPQAAFLPLVPNRGISEVEPQRPSVRYTEEQARRSHLHAGPGQNGSTDSVTVTAV
ncbi:hypothetical protein BGZ83_005305 [Gryganskiella cystojenkinii]|nr:hypothetical protein BGZ83_005305 [Gryganskiella cystojenkinii]